MFSALESQLVSQFCEDENGALIYNHITNGYWNGNSGYGNGINGNNKYGNGINGNNRHGKNTDGNNSNDNNGITSGNSGYEKNENGDNDQEEILNHKRTSSRARGDTFTLPISADPLPVQVCAKHADTAVYCYNCLC